jgi:hypothetical protein
MVSAKQAPSISIKETRLVVKTQLGATEIYPKKGKIESLG